MPLVAQNKEYRTFVGGLFTDASPLTYPENSSKDEDNFTLDINGNRSRRFGLDLEQSAEEYLADQLSPSQFSSAAMSVHYWDNPSNSTGIELVILQYGSTLVAIRTNIAPMTVVTTRNLSGADKGTVWQSTVVNGDLILATGDFCIYRCSYDLSTNGIAVEKHGLLVRDIWGIVDGHKNNRTFSSNHENTEMGDKRLYNILNQGWANRLSYDGKNDNTDYPMVYHYLEDNGLFGVSWHWPNNVMNPSNAWSVTPASVDTDIIKPNPTDQVSPRGHYIIDFFYRGQSRKLVSSGRSLLNNLDTGYEWGFGSSLADGISGAVKYLVANMTTEYFNNIVDETEGDQFTTYLDTTKDGIGTEDLLSDGVSFSDNTGGVSVVADFAGRVFYSGFSQKFEGTDTKSLSPSNIVMYSQVVDSPDKIGKCYQDGDPTGPDTLDLVESDGGFVVIPGLGQVIKMVNLGEYLVILSSNGIWAISGGEAQFSATNFLVTKVSNIKCVSSQSAIVANDTLYFWSEEGIQKIYADKSTLNLLLESITERKISSYYKSLSQFAKTYAQGCYDEQEKTIKWIYNDLDSYDGNSYRFEYNRQLNYNIDLTSFYPYSFESIEGIEGRAPAIAGIFTPPSVNIASDTDTVVINGDPVEINGDPVVITSNTNLETTYSTKYITIEGHSTPESGFYIRIADLNNSEFLDWYSFDSVGVDSPGYMETGYELLGDTQRRKQAVYLTTHMQRTETGFDEEDDFSLENPSGCLVTSYWDFSNHANSGKISTPFQIYRLNRWYVPADTSDEFNYGQSVISTKNKLRGRGRALSLKFSTEPGKNCIIHGWGILFTGNSSP